MTRKNEGKAGMSLREAGIQRWEVQEVHRSQLTNAPYNPRVITKTEQTKLRKILERHGTVEPIVWNKRTGHIVGGHQRTALTDAMMGTNDYRMDVSVIDVPESQEKELNIALNNAAAMGSFDLEGLRKIIEDETVELEGTGFDTTDLMRTFGDTVFENRTQDLEEFTTKLSEISEQYSCVQERNSEMSASERFLVFVFPDGAHVDELLKVAGLPDERYQNGMVLLDRWGVIMPNRKGNVSG
jgi:hypothetical protein